MWNYNTTCLSDSIVSHFTGDVRKNSSVIKANSENLSANGELQFLWSFNAWKNLAVCTENCASILQHFAHTHNADVESDVNTDVAEEVLKQLVWESKKWPLQIHKCILQKERVCLFLNRGDVLANSIRIAIKNEWNLGKSLLLNHYERFSLKCDISEQSWLTFERLRIMRDFAANMLSLHGYTCYLCPLEYMYGTDKYIFTSKSEGPVDKGFKKYVCGVVKNSQTNLKVTNLTWEQYVTHKVGQLAKLNEYKLNESGRGDSEDVFLRSQDMMFLYTLARAIVIFELMVVKPSRAVFIGNNNSTDDANITNTKGVLFVLYNTARIAAIITKYNERVSRGDYPSLPDIENVDFSQLHEEEEWELVYNFILRYPQMMDACMKCEPSFHIYPHTLCLFLLRLSQKFSAYYRKTRILLEGGDHLIPKMVARIYMLHALQAVFRKALSIFNIQPLSRM